MNMRYLSCVLSGLIAFAAAIPSGAVEIATGKMLGSGYDARSFYVRASGGSWQKTYSGSLFQAAAAGRLMNLRIAQGLFEDEWLTEEPFDPEKNTSRLIHALDTYKDHGILAINVSLQAGNPAYERTANIHRGRAAKLGPGKGTLTSAFRPDGSLKEDWMRRTLLLARELDRRGMILNLIYFYQMEDEVLKDPAAIDRAVENATDWLIGHNCRNAIIEIANESNVSSYDHGRYIFRRMDHLIELARRRFETKHAAFRLPISASVTSHQKEIPETIRRTADLTIIHGNGLSPESKRIWVTQLFRDPEVPGPIYMDEDDNGRETTVEHLRAELESCDAVFASGGSWGYMPWVQAQNFPFRYYRPSRAARVADTMPAAERDQAYFHAVLDHVRSLIYKHSAPVCRLSTGGS